MAKKTGSSPIAAPKGGGAVKGIGEKFAPDLFTGTGNFTVPIALPAGRNGFQPQLNLVYSSGTGNGPFGLGWSLTVPGVARKTSKGVPLYDDDQDVFIFSGAEDLVRIGGGTESRAYRPRTEGLFARITHHRNTEDDYWKVESKDGLVSWYGTPGSRADDPATVVDPGGTGAARIFSWKLTRTVDTFGNQSSILTKATGAKCTSRAFAMPTTVMVARCVFSFRSISSTAKGPIPSRTAVRDLRSERASAAARSS